MAEPSRHYNGQEELKKNKGIEAYYKNLRNWQQATCIKLPF